LLLVGIKKNLTPAKECQREIIE
jgi:hypothetical protein